MKHQFDLYGDDNRGEASTASCVGQIIDAALHDASDGGH